MSEIEHGMPPGAAEWKAEAAAKKSLFDKQGRVKDENIAHAMAAEEDKGRKRRWFGLRGPSDSDLKKAQADALDVGIGEYIESKAKPALSYLLEKFTEKLERSDFRLEKRDGLSIRIGFSKNKPLGKEWGMEVLAGLTVVLSGDEATIHVDCGVPDAEGRENRISFTTKDCSSAELDKVIDVVTKELEYLSEFEQHVEKTHNYLFEHLSEKLRRSPVTIREHKFGILSGWGIMLELPDENKLEEKNASDYVQLNVIVRLNNDHEITLAVDDRKPAGAERLGYYVLKDFSPSKLDAIIDFIATEFDNLTGQGEDTKKQRQLPPKIR